MTTTLVDEPSWADTVRITVNVFAGKQVYAHQMVTINDFPKLDFDSVSDLTLQMMESETGD